VQRGLEQKVAKVTKGRSKDPGGSSGREIVAITGQSVLMEKALETRRTRRSLSRTRGELPHRARTAPRGSADPRHHARLAGGGSRVRHEAGTERAALICWLGMWMNHDRTHDPTRPLNDAIKTLADNPNEVGCCG
jgi:hypothetical protein